MKAKPYPKLKTQNMPLKLLTKLEKLSQKLNLKVKVQHYKRNHKPRKNTTFHLTNIKPKLSAENWYSIKSQCNHKSLRLVQLQYCTFKDLPTKITYIIILTNTQNFKQYATAKKPKTWE